MLAVGLYSKIANFLLCGKRRHQKWDRILLHLSIWLVFLPTKEPDNVVHDVPVYLCD